MRIRTEHGLMADQY